MNSLIPYATLFALLAWAEGSLVIALPGLNAPAVHRGIEGSLR
jgi:hypothetical protein